MKFALALFLIVLSEATLAFEVDWSKVVSLRPQRQPNKQSGISGRIVGGKEATPNSFPFQAALFAHVPGDEENQGLCGGSIISPVTILTAAHCFNHNGMYSSWTIVIVGAHNIDNSEASQVRMNATNIKVHKDYNNKTMQNDIAIVILPRRLTYNTYVQPINRPTVLTDTFEGKESTISGWGVVDDETLETSSVLKTATTKIKSNTDCKQYWRNIFDSNICDFSSTSYSTCQGDSGGPVSVLLGGIRVLIGIVSYGGDVCKTTEPSVNTRVTSFDTWITQNMVN